MTEQPSIPPEKLAEIFSSAAMTADECDAWIDVLFASVELTASGAHTMHITKHHMQVLHRAPMLVVYPKLHDECAKHNGALKILADGMTKSHHAAYVHRIIEI